VDDDEETQEEMALIKLCPHSIFDKERNPKESKKNKNKK